MTRTTSQNTNQRNTRRSDSQTANASSRSRSSSRRENTSKKTAGASKGSSRRAASSKASSSRVGENSRKRRQAESETRSRQAEASSRDRRKAQAEQRKRQRTKERANRMYDRQVAASARSHSATPEEGAPRAALYEGKMGSTHRKSARMQRTSEAGPVSAKINPAGWFSNLNISPRLIKVATAVLCIVLVGVFLYVPAKHYYQAQREHDKLVAEYAVVAERNNTIDEQNDALASDAGMEDAVREKYGYISPGEETAVVTGLSEATVESERQAAEVEGNVLSSSVKAPEEWYTPLLDTFFGVE